MNAPVRTLASPYAKRLARERGIPLEGLAGSGPNGRIVAGDVPLAPVAVAATPAAVAAAPAAAPARSVAAFSASVDLAALAEVIAASGTALPIDAFLVKAAARAAGARSEAVRWMKAEGGAVTIPRAVALAPTEIARLIADASEESPTGKALVLSRLAVSRIRPVAGSLPVDADLRLLVVAGDEAATAEVLLVHDDAVIPEGEAAEILGAFRDLIEAPLRLLV
jgi:pyruvate/2-oxoglutarate dehydrogenase complex dihydrolipoamide acyltransferase (E2) component